MSNRITLRFSKLKMLGANPEFVERKIYSTLPLDNLDGICKIDPEKVTMEPIPKFSHNLMFGKKLMMNLLKCIIYDLLNQHPTLLNKNG